jgi:oligopeptide transport system ATP-binding protein
MENLKTLLDVNDLNVRFHTPEGIVYAVNGATFKVYEGETLALVGESGSGKSVSMMSILGLIPLPPGEINGGPAFYRNRNLLTLPEKDLIAVRGKEIALIFQDPMTSLNPVLTMGRQLTEAVIKHYHVTKSEARKKAMEFLELVGIPEARGRFSNYPHQFSGGMRQRVMIAMMLALKPSLLVADEPTTALDVTIQAKIVDLVKDIKQKIGMSMIWITHDLGVVAGLADRVIVMYAGTVVEEANVDDLYKKAKHPYTIALLAALPMINSRRGAERLKTIPGSPPNCHHLPTGCAFAPRCDFVQDQCWKCIPPLESVADDHFSACWVDVKTGALRS